MKRSPKMLLVLLLCSVALPAFAREVNGVRVSDSITVSGKSLQLNGLGVRTKTIFGIKVYVAGLYLETPSHDPGEIIANDGVRRLVLHMTHDAPKTRLIDEFRDGLESNSEKQLPALKVRLDRFLAALPDVVEGQALTLTYVPGEGTRLEMPGGKQHTVEGKDFADALLRMWIGPEPLDTDLKTRLLGNR
jgi:hypothetical protein